VKTTIKNICVYCGSNLGVRNSYSTAARTLAEVLVAHDITLIYGGGNVGLMGIMADSVLSAGGRAIGVIPQALVDKELAHGGLSDLRIVGSMHERKSMMADLADAFIALPGGLGTLEELCEVATWAQLGLHRKACGVLNIEGYYDDLLAMLDHAAEEKFIRPEHRKIILSETEPDKLIKKLTEYESPILHKWIKQNEQ
jgi:uncharacterized protein (TIGR00730 family)